jgi:LEA14-like dessication related protein
LNVPSQFVPPENIAQLITSKCHYKDLIANIYDTQKYKNQLLNSKILLIAIVAALAGIIGFIALSGSQLINDVSEGGLGKPTTSTIKVLPLEIQLEKLSILSVSEEEATLRIDFKVTNPNYKSVILQIIKYELYEDGKRLTIEQIGERPEGMVDSSNYFTILSNNPQIIGDTFTIKNTGNTPEFWSALSNNNIKWLIKGEAYFNLSSMTSGQENIVSFEFEA